MYETSDPSKDQFVEQTMLQTESAVPEAAVCLSISATAAARSSEAMLPLRSGALRERLLPLPLCDLHIHLLTRLQGLPAMPGDRARGPVPVR